jgi:hypothetical protein
MMQPIRCTLLCQCPCCSLLCVRPHTQPAGIARTLNKYFLLGHFPRKVINSISNIPATGRRHKSYPNPTQRINIGIPTQGGKQYHSEPENSINHNTPAFSVMPSICGSSVWKLLSILLAPRLMWVVTELSKSCGHLVYTMK